MGNDWDELLREEFDKPYYQKLRRILAHEYKKYKICPDMSDIFNALKLTAYEKTKVVLLGQDPYHGENQAHGLAFSVKEGIQFPPSLVNIFKEIQNDLARSFPETGCLTQWAEQGVLLLNTTLTVRSGQPNSHKAIGWEIFTDKVISLLAEHKKPLVFLLWGAHARSKMKLLEFTNHKILIAPHPSPLSAHRGFFGCKHFSASNSFLENTGQKPIQW